MDDNDYRPRWTQNGNNVSVSGVISIEATIPNNTPILSGLPYPSHHLWTTMDKIGTDGKCDIYITYDGKIKTGGSTLHGAEIYAINFSYLIN